MTNKLVLSVLGQDRPGIVAEVSSVLCDLDCNIEDCSQTILQTEFAAIFIVKNLKTRRLADIEASLKKALEDRGLRIYIKTMAPERGTKKASAATPLVITTLGVDQLGMIAAITGALAALQVNIVNFKAILRKEARPVQLMTILEVEAPVQVEQNLLNRRLREVASRFPLEFTVQHRAIFEATNKI